MMLAAKKKGMIGGDFNCITHPEREAEDGGEDTLAITTRGWQKRIMERGVTHQKDVESGLPEIILQLPALFMRNDKTTPIKQGE